MSTTTVPPSTPLATARLVKRVAEPEPELDFALVDYHVLHKRGELFERQDEAEEEQGKEEFSTSINRQGETFTLVKTTRPIVRYFLSTACAFATPTPVPVPCFAGC